MSAAPDLSQSDLVQEAWMRVSQRLHLFNGINHQGEIGGIFCNWLRSTARHAMLNTVNGKKRIPTVRIETGQIIGGQLNNSPIAEAQDREQAELLSNAISNLSSECDREILQMVFWDRVSLRQVAIALDLEYSQLRRRFHKILDSLAEQLISRKT